MSLLAGHTPEDAARIQSNRERELTRTFDALARLAGMSGTAGAQNEFRGAGVVRLMEVADALREQGGFNTDFAKPLVPLLKGTFTGGYGRVTDTAGKPASVGEAFTLRLEHLKTLNRAVNGENGARHDTVEQNIDMARRWFFRAHNLG